MNHNLSLMKHLLIILVCLLLNEAIYGQSLEGSWIITSTKGMEGVYGSPYNNGKLLHFENDIFIISTINSQWIKNYEYSIQNDSILSDSIFLGIITHSSSNSLVIQYKAQTFLAFPLVETNYTLKDREKILDIVLNTCWLLDLTHMQYHFYLDSMLKSQDTESFEDSNLQTYLYKNIYKDKIYYGGDLWTFKYFKGKIIVGFYYGFSLAYFQFDNKGLRNDIFNGFLCNNEDDKEPFPAIFKKKNLLSKTELNNLQNQLIGKWKVTHLNTNTSKWLEPENLPSYSEPLKDYTGFSLNNLKSQNIQFILSENGENHILIDGKLVRTEDSWSITSDGKYIGLGNFQRISNLIEIIQITNNHIIIRKYEPVECYSEKHDKRYSRFEWLEFVMERE